MATRDITYHFILDKGREEFFDIAIDENSYVIKDALNEIRYLFGPYLDFNCKP
ncbi:MAG: hypothetical protein KQH63_07205 [Desulfobulbaceae bacterium]|nr:hypothetical protein [Desulfobulbaceae bacterium]